MKVLKRNGELEAVSMDKITRRVENLSKWLNVDAILVAKRVVNGLYDGVSTIELDSLAAETSASMASIHPDYSLLAGRIEVSNLHKQTDESFSTVMKRLHEVGIVAKYVVDMAVQVEPVINYELDFNFDYFAIKTLMRSYLLKIDGVIVERPQHMFMRVAIDINRFIGVVSTYMNLAEGNYMHATPTLFNAGTVHPQMSSCFLATMESDSIEGIFNTLKKTALISKYAGGIGLSINDIRAKGSPIKGTNGTSNGLVPMLKVFNDTARYVDQGGGKRKGSFAVYIEPWHADIVDFLQMKKNHGAEEMRARDLFYALWINDLFMERVESNGNWSLFCPSKAVGLSEVYGSQFNKMYLDYEAQGFAIKTMKAQELWKMIVESQIETGNPYLLYKDSANEKSNQKNLGTIKSSNLCCEIMEYTAPNEIAVCNLASIALPKFVKNGKVDYEGIYKIAQEITFNLNDVIDGNYYPVEEAKYSNLRNRPIGIGVQGLADVFMLLRIPFDSPQAKEINKKIFAHIYAGALIASSWLAKLNVAYDTYEGSPASRGMLQFDLWGVKPVELEGNVSWYDIRDSIVKYGLRNSLLVAPMPTASTSQILGNNECFEPYTSNIYTRRTLSGEFIVVNKHLVKHLEELGLWNEHTRKDIIRANGSVQDLPYLSDEFKAIYKTAYEISQRDIIDMAADRGAYICQSQSMNLFVTEPTVAKLSSMHFYAWKKGLKTGCYYLRTKAATQATQFTV